MATQRSPKRKQKQETEEDKILRLYEPFRFLEKDHWGEYLIVTNDGRYVVGPNEGEALHEAFDRFGPGLTILRVGEVAAGIWPWLKGR